ncbi:LysR family transcriptional regulator [Photobacterium sp. WH77]|uniref:LysR family transcriptional regulator n=1 Tax=unclassified Photobacterium TaxID=2628852 RepID=UPI001ED9D24A|nr:MULTISPECIES: LysR family transcriptional regulator [unclassified Photobacterium]MCG2836450.1 LysR family transcriptional regulator [Photobacterium sp. WH77]MCG2843923.1 LysR family transcriptional regulator [Photobacterium sp. WH80]
MDKLRSLEIFLATCDGESFAAAARSCNTDPSTVSKAISRLEAQLGLTLFQRSTRQLRITAAGQRYADTVRKMIQDLTVCEYELKHLNDSPSGTLRISSAVCYGHLYLRPLLQAFCQRYPAIKLDLEINDLHADIIENDIDVALRTGYVKDSRLVARRLSPMDFLVCASPHYLAAQGTPQCADDFHQHSWIGFRIKETRQLQPIFLPNEQGEYVPYELERTHVTDDGEAMACMCADGLGFAQLPHFLAKQGLNNGTLVSLYPYFRPPQPDNGVFAIYPKREYLPAKVRVFIEFMTASLASMGESTNHTWAENWAPLVSGR